MQSISEEVVPNSKEFVKSLQKTGFKLKEVALIKGELVAKYLPSTETYINGLPGCTYIKGGRGKIRIQEHSNAHYKSYYGEDRIDNYTHWSSRVIGVTFEKVKCTFIIDVVGIKVFVHKENVYTVNEGINCGAAGVYIEETIAKIRNAVFDNKWEGLIHQFMLTESASITMQPYPIYLLRNF